MVVSGWWLARATVAASRLRRQPLTTIHHPRSWPRATCGRGTQRTTETRGHRGRLDRVAKLPLAGGAGRGCPARRAGATDDLRVLLAPRTAGVPIARSLRNGGATPAVRRQDPPG